MGRWTRSTTGSGAHGPRPSTRFAPSPLRRRPYLFESPESILRSGDSNAVNAFATLSDASDALAKIGTVQRHLREAQNGRDEASARYDHFADPNVARRAPKHRLSYALWLVSPGVNATFRTVAESREMQAKADAIQGGRRAIAQASAGGAVVVN